MKKYQPKYMPIKNQYKISENSFSTNENNQSFIFDPDKINDNNDFVDLDNLNVISKIGRPTPSDYQEQKYSISLPEDSLSEEFSENLSEEDLSNKNSNIEENSYILFIDNDMILISDKLQDLQNKIKELALSDNPIQIERMSIFKKLAIKYGIFIEGG